MGFDTWDVTVRMPSGLTVRHRIYVDADTLSQDGPNRYEQFEELALGFGGSLVDYEYGFYS